MRNSWNRLYVGPSAARDLGGLPVIHRNAGPVIGPAIDLQRAIYSLPEDGGRITLGEGIYQLYETLTVRKKNVALVSTSPGKTIIRRSSSTSGVMIRVDTDASGFLMAGVAIQDVSPTNTDATVEILAPSATVKDSIFVDYHLGIYVKDTYGAKFTCNRFELGAERGSYCVYLHDADDCIVSTNDFHEASLGFPAVYADDDSERVSIVGNLTSGANQISIKTGKFCSTAGNTPDGTSVQVRP